MYLLSGIGAEHRNIFGKKREIILDEKKEIVDYRVYFPKMGKRY